MRRARQRGVRQGLPGALLSAFERPGEARGRHFQPGDPDVDGGAASVLAATGENGSGDRLQASRTGRARGSRWCRRPGCVPSPPRPSTVAAPQTTPTRNLLSGMTYSWTCAFRGPGSVSWIRLAALLAVSSADLQVAYGTGSSLWCPAVVFAAGLVAVLPRSPNRPPQPHGWPHWNSARPRVDV